MLTQNHQSRAQTRVAATFAGLVFLLGVPSVQAQEAPLNPELNLSRVPLFLNQAVDPNLLVSFDDSGSMAFAYMPDDINTNCNWRHPRYYWHGHNRVYYNPDINYVPPLQPNGTPFPAANFNSAWLDGYEAATAIVAGAGGSSTVNLGRRYFPTRSKNARDGTGNGTRVGHDWRARNTVNCNNDGGANNNNAALPFADNSRTGTNLDSSAFYYRFTGTDPNDPTQVADPDNFVAVNLNAAGADQQANFANWYSYYRTRYLFARTAASRAFAVLDQNVRVAWQNFNNNRLGATDEIRPLQGPWRTNFFNWLYRTQSSGGTPLRRAMIDAGNFFERSGNNFQSPYWEPGTAASPPRELSCRQNFHITLSDGFWNEGDPSTASFGARGDDNTGHDFPPDPRFDPPRVVSYAPSGLPSTIFWNEGNTNRPPTLAEIAFNFWRRDLRPDLDNNVAPFLPDLRTGITGPAVPPGGLGNPILNDEIYFNPANNPAVWQHMVNFIVGLGVAGTLNYPDDLVRLRRGEVEWPGPQNNDATGVDDTWHAALNSRGEYFSAQDPNELVLALTRLFSSVQARRSSITPVSLSGSILTTLSKAYRTGFDTSDWSGSLVGFAFVPDDPATPLVDEESFLEEWRAEDLLDLRDPDGRLIFASADAEGDDAVPFRWSSLSTEQQSLLRTEFGTNVVQSSAVGEARVNYVRGDRTEELSAGGPLRNRNTVLGAIVSSAAVFVGTPQEIYEDAAADNPDSENFSFESFLSPNGVAAEREALANGEGYQQDFLPRWRNRSPNLYVGGNGGMLHAFDELGNERWGFVPYAAFENLNRLTSPTDLDFQSFVDATPVVRDVFFSGAWRTVLVGTMRLGGQSVFALDVTDPVVGSEPEGSGRLLWEFSDESTDGEDLGYTYGEPFITRLHNRRWVALVPGGYNSVEADGNAGTGEGALYVLDIQTGNVIRKFALGAGSIGLSGVVAGDYRLGCDGIVCERVGRNVRDVTDVAFAGDLSGNLWRFDLTSDSPGNWTAEVMFEAISPTTGRAQPITARPWLAATPDERVVVLFGTGKYLEPGDRSRLIPVQSMYGVYDQGPGAPDYPIQRNQLLQQTQSYIGGDFSSRTATFAPLDPDFHRGWYFDMLDQGERVIVQAGVRETAGIAIVASLIPLSEDPCIPNAQSFLSFVDVSNGGIPGSGSGARDLDGDGQPDFVASFDTNGDGKVDATDNARLIGTRVDTFVAGVTPISVPGGGEARLILPSEDGDLGVNSLVLPDFQWRRRSWRELFSE